MKIDTKVFLISIIFFFLIFKLYGDFLYSNFLNQLIIFALPIIWPGLAHGSLDVLTAKRIKLIFSKFSYINFIIIYLTIPLVFFIFWIKIPKVFFILFLFLSLFHFGYSDRISNSRYLKFLEVLIRGSIIIIFPLKFHFEETKNLFSYFFIDENFSLLLLYYFDTLVYPIIFLFLIYNFFFFKHKKYKLICFEFLMLMFCFFYFKPLTSFLIYFCFLHSIRHLNDEMNLMKIDFNQLIFRTIPMTLIPLILIICFITIFYFTDFLKYNDSVKYLVIAFSSLTISHIILINFLKNDQSL